MTVMTSLSLAVRDLFGDSIVVESLDPRKDGLPFRIHFEEKQPEGWSRAMVNVGFTDREFIELQGNLLSTLWCLVNGVFDPKHVRTMHARLEGFDWVIQTSLVSVPPEESERTRDALVMEVSGKGLDDPIYCVFDSVGVEQLARSIEESLDKRNERRRKMREDLDSGWKVPI